MAPAEATFRPLPDSINFPAEEESTLAYWAEIDAFQESLRQSKGKPPFNFYDGPPFATGLPHYGHILAGTIKDVVTRHAHQRGYHVERRFGWDCHGVPVEGIIDAKLKIRGRADVMEMGIDKYNEECRGVVQKYTKEWRDIITRFGRWIDFDNDYKTMQLSYMESVWWAFKQLFDKGMVYRSWRVIAFSTALGTPMSNFEASQNYKEVSDPSIIVQFKRTDRENSYILAWTTTPWTLPSNLALCVHPTLKYLLVKRKDDGQEWVVGKDRWDWVCSSIKKDGKKDFEILEEVEGNTLVGIQYEPLFDYWKGTGKVNEEKCWRVVSDKYVTTGAGTCVVHQAPAYGEDDNRVCKLAGIILKDCTYMVDPVDDSGRFMDPISDFKGQFIKDADKGIKQKLKDKGQLLFNGTEVHNYPLCWRSDTPLIYKAIPAWFIKVEEVRDRIIKCNNETYWVPSFVKEKRFHNWLVDARDWCVSRNRYWGAPLPLWVSDDFEEIVCIGSVAELEEYAGRKITDLHRHFIDDIQIPSKQGKGMLKRVDEVFDCWFESGAMPYASKHYPFENKEDFEKSFPAQFIAEGLDQTRGWFYTLMVLSTIIFDKPAFKNLIVNGLVLAGDGKKMSKRLQNYPDPSLMCGTYGADAVRMYMCNSPVVRAEPLKFSEAGVKDVVKDVFLPWYNSYKFFILEATRFESEGRKFKPDTERIKKSENFMDKWIFASTHNLIKFVREEMDAYRLYTVVGELTRLLESLTNSYIRLNRDRMRGQNGVEEAETALCTLYEVLLTATVMLAPVTPFITEMIYQNLSRALPDGHPLKAKSIHWIMVPEFDPSVLNPDIEVAVQRMQGVVELGRQLREQAKIGQKMPLKSMVIVNKDPAIMKDLQTLQSYIQEELNVMECTFKSAASGFKLTATLNFKMLGKKLGKDMKAVAAAVKELGTEELTKFEESGKMTIAGYEILAEEMTLAREMEGGADPNVRSMSDGSSTVVLDFTPDPELSLMMVSREISNRVNRMRKDAKLHPDAAVDMWAEAVDAKEDSKLQETLTKNAAYNRKLLRRNLYNNDLRQGHEVVVRQEDFDIETAHPHHKQVTEKLRVVITTRCAFFNLQELGKLTGGDKAEEEAVKQFVLALTVDSLAEMCKKGSVEVTTASKAYKLEHQVHCSLGPGEAEWLK